MTERNPLIEPENYYEGYNESARKLAATEAPPVQLDELAFKVLGTTEDGKLLLEQFKERYIYPSTPCQLGSNGYSYAISFYEGFREAFRQIIGLVQGYEKRKLYEAKQAEFSQSEEKFNGEF